MDKIISCWKIELLILFRNVWTWATLLLSLTMVGIQFYSRVVTDDPGGALISTAFIVQGGLFVSMIFGLYLIRSEVLSSSDEMFYVIPNGYSGKLFGKCLALLSAIVLFIFLSVLILYLLYYIFEIPFIFYWKSIPYLTLYWAIPFFIAGIIGMIVGTYQNSRIVYPILILAALLMGPLNVPITENVMALLHTDLTPIMGFLNLGQTDPNSPFDPVYGLPMEIHRWLQKGLWLIAVVFLFSLRTIQINYQRFPKWGLLLLPGFFIAMFPFIYLFLQEEQVVKTGIEVDSVRKYDLNYYTMNTKANFENMDSVIESYEIDVKSFRNLKVRTKMKVKPLKETNHLVFTLYHQLKVQSVTTENNTDLIFHQMGDQVKVIFPELLPAEKLQTIIINYEGTSSQYYFANEQAVMLPSYFPWLPIAGSYQAMTAEGLQLRRYPLLPNHSTEYVLRYSGPEPLHTNLSIKGEGVWSGKVPNGLTIVSGMLTEMTIRKTKIVYPISLYKMIHTVPEYVDKVEAIRNNIQSDFSMQRFSDISTVYLLSIPNESMTFPLNIWTLDDHMIIGVNQMYNNGDLLHNELFLVPSVLSSMIRSSNIVNQKMEMQTLFLESYSYWYSLRDKSNFNNEIPLMKQHLKFYKTIPTSREETKAKYKQKAFVTEEIIRFIDNNKHNEKLLRAFFQNWLDRLDQNEPMNENDILEMFDRRV